VLSPRSLTFPPGNPAPKQVAITAPDPNNNDIAIVKDSCTPQHIVTAIQPSPPPPSPSPSPLSSVYNVTPGKTNGSCKVTFEDLISMALGALHITNLSGAPVRSP
jgi:hypothetical protein